MKKVKIDEKELEAYIEKAKAFDLLKQIDLLRIESDYDRGYSIQAYDSENNGCEILKSQYDFLKQMGIKNVR